MVYILLNAADRQDFSSVRERFHAPRHRHASGIFNVNGLEEGLTDLLLSFFPEASDDSFATVNLLGAHRTLKGRRQVVEDPALFVDYFTGTEHFAGERDSVFDRE